MTNETCSRGHPFRPRKKGAGKVRCAECGREADRRYRMRLRERREGVTTEPAPALPRLEVEPPKGPSPPRRFSWQEGKA